MPRRQRVSRRPRRPLRRLRRRVRKMPMYKKISNLTYPYKRFGYETTLFAQGIGSVMGKNYTGGLTTASPVSIGTPLSTGLAADSYWVPFSIAGNLNDVVNNSEFTSLYDKYFIKGYAIKINYKSPTSSDLTSNPYPTIAWVQDYDDNSLPSTREQLREYANYKETPFTSTQQTVNIYIRKPKHAQQLYDNNITSAYAPRRGYIDCTYPTVPHYGIKGWLQDVYLPNSGGINTLITISLVYYLQMKNVR